MSLEPIGLATIAIGLLCLLLLGYRAVFQVFVFATLFGAAAAILIGWANVQPAHLLLAFVIVATLAHQRETAAAVSAVSAPKPGFWLMCLLLYGILTAMLMPRLLAGATQIVPLGLSEYSGTSVPLGPVSGNFTQSIYLLADVICFAITVAIASSQVGFLAVANSIAAYAIGNTLFAVLDLGTYATGSQWILDFMRNARYTLHIEEEIHGLKRIVGSFPEASAFARSTLGVLGFTGTLWLCGCRPVLNGALALASLVLVVLSTSSTGLAGAPLVLAILYVTALMRHGFHPSRSYGSAMVLCAPLLLAAVVLAVLLNQEVFETARQYLDSLIFNKSISRSAIERDVWNSSALQNFFDSYGLGVGLGTVRTSSLVFALLSNVGVPGLIFYLLFAVSAFGRLSNTGATFQAEVRLAARNACLSLLVADAFVSPVVEQGILFYVLAGIACAKPSPEEVAALAAEQDRLTEIRK